VPSNLKFGILGSFGHQGSQKVLKTLVLNHKYCQSDPELKYFDGEKVCLDRSLINFENSISPQKEKSESFNTMIIFHYQFLFYFTFSQLQSSRATPRRKVHPRRQGIHEAQQNYTENSN
jgi:hypothetical protein